MAGQGQLVQIRPISANLLHNTGLFTKKDPYCVVRLGSQQQRTAPNWKGGSHPKWTEIFVLTRTYEDHIKFIVCDRENITSDDHVGQGELHFVNVPMGVSFEGFVKLYHRNRDAGDLHVAVQYLSQPVPAAPMPIGTPLSTNVGGMTAQGSGVVVGGGYPPAGYAPYPNPSAPVGYPSAPAGYPNAPYPSAPVTYPPQSYAPVTVGQASPTVVVIEEERHRHGHHGHHGHHHHHNNRGPDEVIIVQPGAYPAPGYTSQPISYPPGAYPGQYPPGYQYPPR